MRFKDIKEGGVYRYDVNNLSRQMETGILVVKVLNKPNTRWWQMAKPPVKCCPIRMSDGSLAEEYPMGVHANMLEPITDDIRRNIVVRYPIDLPIFNEVDVKAIQSAIDIIRGAIGGGSEAPLLMARLAVLEEKVRFYQDKAENTNNGLPNKFNAMPAEDMNKS